MSTRLSDSDIGVRLASLAAWTQHDNTISKVVKLDSFPGAIAFVTQVGFLAEAAAHHPDIDIRWRTVRLTLSTHDVGGLTEQDFTLAAQIDKLSA